ncbi:hypothetical protein BH10PSE17_BH10PSE17_38500 [soil metagenome]
MPREIVAMLAIAAWAVICHWLSSTAPDHGFTALVMLGPVVGTAIVAAWRAPRPIGIPLLALIASGIAGFVLLFDKTGIARWSYLIEHVSMNAAAGLVFGLSLRPGHTPLITTIARRVHGELPPRIDRYTRRSTVAWTLYFGVICVASIALFLSGSIDRWSWLANIVTPLGIALLFVGDFVLRRRLFPDFEHVGMLTAMRAAVATRIDHKVAS